MLPNSWDKSLELMLALERFSRSPSNIRIIYGISVEIPNIPLLTWTSSSKFRIEQKKNHHNCNIKWINLALPGLVVSEESVTEDQLARERRARHGKRGRSANWKTHRNRELVKCSWTHRHRELVECRRWIHLRGIGFTFFARWAIYSIVW